MNATIVSIGSELTQGQQVDTNAAWLSAELTRLGLHVLGHVCVDDDTERIRRALCRALAESAWVVTTGGLGPTPDDLTRHALAQVINAPLEENAAALEHLRATFERQQRAMHPSNAIQAMIPRGCEILPNARGTAPGIHYAGPRCELFALPGVPHEMKAMFDATVVPALGDRAGGNRTVLANIRCYGISEAKLGELLTDLMERNRNPLVGTAAARGVITVRVAADGRDETEAAHLLTGDVDEIRRRLGRAVFGSGDETLSDAVGRLLAGRGRTIATAESCTGGWLSTQITDPAGSSAYFLRGYVTYSNEAKSALLGVPPELIASEGAVSEPVARAMASGCRTVAGSDYALSITGIAGPAGGNPPDKPVGLVYLGLAGPTGTEVTCVLLGEHLTRGEVRDRACSAALNLLRLHLLSADTK